MDFNTALLHGKACIKRGDGSTLPPVYQVSAFEQESAEKLEKVFAGKAAGFAYSRIGNPTVDAFERRMAELEKGIGAVACASGMSAAAMSLLNILRAGDEVIVSSGLFGGTIDLFGDLAQLGITARFAEEFTCEHIEPLITDKTKAIFTELIGNPRLDIADMSALAELAHSRCIPLIIDSTTATPYLTHPFDFGADIVIHSASKYINGNGTAIGGVIIDSGSFDWTKNGYDNFDEYSKFGKFAYLAKLRNGIWRNVGACLSPVNAFLDIMGLETLGLRMERCCYNAYELAKFLDELPGIEVNYPGLEKSAYYGLAKKQLGGKGGAILTIRAGSRDKAFKLINSLRYAVKATNIGDVRTLVIHPASTIYLHNDEKQKLSAGVYDDTIRISVGIEDINDLKEDFLNAVKCAQ